MATFFNQATLSYNGTVINSNIIIGEVREVLTMTKTAVVDTYTQGSQVTYVVSIVNTGTAAVADLTITDDLGAYEFNGTTLVPLTYVPGSVTYFVNGVLQADPAVVSGPPLVIQGIDVPAGGVVSVIYVAQVNQFAPPVTDGTITNTVLVEGACAAEASETITARNEAELTIAKSLCPTTVTCGGTLTYTFVIQNTGNTPVVATDNAVVTDTFDPALTNIAVTFNGVAWTAPATYTYNEATGEFATAIGQITVPAATYTQDPATGVWTIQPGVSTLTVTGTL